MSAPAARAAVVAALVAVVGALTGCVSIPAQGPIVAGRQLAGHANVRFFPNGPGPGDTPVAIVRGFILAAVNFELDHNLARSFLTPDTRTTWRPDSPVIVYADQDSLQTTQVDSVGVTSAATPSATASAKPSAKPSVKPSAKPSAKASAKPSGKASASAVPPVPRSEVFRARPADGASATVQVRVAVTARILDGGVYRVSEPGDGQVELYHLIAHDGEWRISDPADGMLIVREKLAVTFAEVPLYYPDRRGAWLVPDLRWFPQASSPTVAIAALLEGPSSWLAAAVDSGAPPGTELTANGVRVDDTGVTIDLTKRALDATPLQRQRLAAQLTATLAEAAQAFDFPFGDVKITVEQTRYEIPPWTVPVPRVADDVPLDARPVVLDDKNHLARLDLFSATPVAGIGALSAAASHPAMSPDPQHPVFAVLRDDRTHLLTITPAEPPRVVATGVDLTAPSFDPLGWVWTTPAACTGVFEAIQGTRRVQVAAHWLADYRVLSVRLSREGDRALIIAEHGGSPSAFVTGVVRQDDGTPSSVTVPIHLVPDLTSAVDGAWVDGRSVVILGSRTGSPTRRSWFVQIGGDIDDATIDAGDAQSVTAGTKQYDLWVQTPKGVQTRVAAGFQPVKGVRWPAVPG